MKKNCLMVSFLLASILLLGMFLPAGAVCAKESAGRETADSDTETNILMYTKEKLTAMSGPDTTYDVVTKLEAESPVVVVGKTVNNWYQFYFDGNIAYIPGDKLKEPPVNESLDQEMEAHAKNDVLEIESFVRQQKEAAKAKVWGIIIAVLIVAIFALGIISTMKASKTAEEHGEKKENPDMIDQDQKVRDQKAVGTETAIKDTIKQAQIRRPDYKKPIETKINIIDLESGDDAEQ